MSFPQRTMYLSGERRVRRGGHQRQRVRIVEFAPDVRVRQRRGELVAVCTTGAYNYSMASNYNRFPRPPVVMLRGGENYPAVKRETVEDVLALDV